MIHISPDAKFRIRVDGKSMLVKCFQILFHQGKEYNHLQDLEQPYRMFWYDAQAKKEVSKKKSQILQILTQKK